MPTWCSQFVEVRGEEKEIKRMINSFRVDKSTRGKYEEESGWDINQLFPVPDELAETPHASIIPEWSQEEKDLWLKNKQEENLAKFGARDWYEWQIKNYGTKWGASYIQIDEEALSNCSDSFSFKFESPWCTCPGLMAKVSSLFPSVLIGIHAIEQMNMFAVWETYHDGEMIEYGGADVDTQNIDSDDRWGQCLNDMFKSVSKGSADALDKNMDLIKKS
jgi:hypothetical protein